MVAIFLVTIVSKANAKYTMVNEFCGDRYCGQYFIKEVRYHHYKSHRKVTHRRHRAEPRAIAHAKIKPKPIQVANIGTEPLGEPPPVKTSLLQKAKSYLGSNPTGWRSLWCARFIAYIAPAVADRLKRMGLNPNWARDYARLPGSKHYGRIGDLVVLSRGRGGHIGFVEGFDKRGNPIVISGNHGHKVGRGIYSKSRVLAYATI